MVYIMWKDGYNVVLCGMYIWAAVINTDTETTVKGCQIREPCGWMAWRGDNDRARFRFSYDSLAIAIISVLGDHMLISDTKHGLSSPDMAGGVRPIWADMLEGGFEFAWPVYPFLLEGYKRTPYCGHATLGQGGPAVGEGLMHSPVIWMEASMECGGIVWGISNEGMWDRD
ncbi:hypothetical protein PCH_Pc22g12220 [Penicillium rubens Wisconsin 54-1255]|uniref:Uncharacterized protein n=1 Tax=Penicillium rubens (strain ATCC 28089 / DSM 1075 / NRRL 1951 / Wisconsin 54-1255) TaxID=500485 RepID=B6HRG5_PENRW|nr:hypothetical protein PCH_Pc22g12220 [Penicillium rubens Wisconsin 54-1255]